MSVHIDIEAAPPDPWLVRGVRLFAVETPPEKVVLSGGWLRRGDSATLIGSAGHGKSTLANPGAMAWSAGLPFLGIRPPAPLRVLLVVGEDDETALAEAREGLIEHAVAITGAAITDRHLDLMDRNLRIDFARTAVGMKFFTDRLEPLLGEEPADLVLINPLLAYIGGEIVQAAPEWLRTGMGPVTQRHACAAMIVSHTPVMRAKDAWEATADVYAGTGGGEVANYPRAVLVLRPTKADGLHVLTSNKRKHWWPDEDGGRQDRLFLRRSDDPSRPAWLPVPFGEAEAMLADTGREHAVTVEHVVAAVTAGPMQRTALLDRLKREHRVKDTAAKVAIKDALDEGAVVITGTEKRPGGGHPIQWVGLPSHNGRHDGRDH